jgi:NAD(P)-dependent dehydrogenase (short-subunit alcohol dehydrogenase family)
MINEVVPSMIKLGGGVILNNSSTFGFVVASNFGVYCMCKAAIISLTRSYALELAKYRIRVNSICPGGTTSSMHSRYLGGKRTEEEKKRLDELILRKTKFGELVLGTELEKTHLSKHPIGRFASPYDIARAALFLVSDESDYMTGSAMLIDGGYTII